MIEPTKTNLQRFTPFDRPTNAESAPIQPAIATLRLTAEWVASNSRIHNQDRHPFSPITPECNWETAPNTPESEQGDWQTAPNTPSTSDTSEILISPSRSLFSVSSDDSASEARRSDTSAQSQKSTPRFTHERFKLSPSAKAFVPATSAPPGIRNENSRALPAPQPLRLSPSAKTFVPATSAHRAIQNETSRALPAPQPLRIPPRARAVDFVPATSTHRATQNENSRALPAPQPLRIPPRARAIDFVPPMPPSVIIQNETGLLISREMLSNLSGLRGEDHRVALPHLIPAINMTKTLRKPGLEKYTQVFRVASNSTYQYLVVALSLSSSRKLQVLTSFYTNDEFYIRNKYRRDESMRSVPWEQIKRELPQV